MTNHSANEYAPHVGEVAPPGRSSTQPNYNTMAPDNARENTQSSRDSESRPISPTKSKYLQFLFDARSTPGLQSNSFVLRNVVNTWHNTKLTLLNTYMNLLLIMVPMGIISGKQGWNPVLVFVFNSVSIIPLAADLSFAMEQISLQLGEAMGGLLNATLGNAVELIVSIVALMHGEIGTAQFSLLGSILSNLLLVVGMSFFIGGLVNRGVSGNGLQQYFASATAQTTCSLMVLSSASLIVATVFYTLLDWSSADVDDTSKAILTLSRGTAVVLLLIYILYLVFRLRTHSNLFDPENQQGSHEYSEPKVPALEPVAATATLAIIIIFATICVRYLVESIDPLVTTSGIKKSFVGFIIIPFVGNAAEHVTAVRVAMQDKMDLAIGIAINSSIQLALFLTPCLVILGWIIGKEMTLHFESMQITAFAVSILFLTYIVQDSKSNYFEGAALLGFYSIIAVVIYLSP